MSRSLNRRKNNMSGMYKRITSAGTRRNNELSGEYASKAKVNNSFDAEYERFIAEQRALITEKQEAQAKSAVERITEEMKEEEPVVAVASEPVAESVKEEVAEEPVVKTTTRKKKTTTEEA